MDLSGVFPSFPAEGYLHNLLLLYPLCVAFFFCVRKVRRARSKAGDAQRSANSCCAPTQPPPEDGRGADGSHTASALPSAIPMPTAASTSLSLLPPIKPSKSPRSWLSVLKMLQNHLLLLISSLPRAWRTLIWVVRTAIVYKW